MWNGHQIKREVKDSLNREIIYQYPPKRIISLVPSITELLYDLEVGEYIVATTDYCIYPEQARNTTKIGGTKTPDIDKIYRLKPDIVIAEKNENSKNRVLKIAEKFPVFVFDVRSFDDAINMIRTVGDLVGKKPLGRIISEKIMQKFIDYAIDFQQKTVFFPVWKNPYITISKDTFISSFLQLLNLRNIFENKEKAYPKITIEELKANCPDFIFLPDEPYSFTPEDAAELKALCPNSEIVFVKGEMFIWFGSRLLKAADYIKNLHQKLFK